MERKDIIKDWVISESVQFAFVDGERKEARIALTVDEKGRIVPSSIRRDPPFFNDTNKCWMVSYGTRPITLVGLDEDPAEISADELELRYDALSGFYSDSRFITTDEDGDSAKDYFAWATCGLDEDGKEALRIKLELDSLGKDEIEAIVSGLAGEKILFDAVIDIRRKAGVKHA